MPGDSGFGGRVAEASARKDLVYIRSAARRPARRRVVHQRQGSSFRAPATGRRRQFPVHFGNELRRALRLAHGVADTGDVGFDIVERLEGGGHNDGRAAVLNQLAQFHLRVAGRQHKVRMQCDDLLETLRSPCDCQLKYEALRLGGGNEDDHRLTTPLTSAALCSRHYEVWRLRLLVSQ